MADNEPKTEEDVLVGEEEGNDEVRCAIAFTRNEVDQPLGGDFGHEEEGCRDGRGGC
jgi:hypothetical protein